MCQPQLDHAQAKGCPSRRIVFDAPILMTDPCTLSHVEHTRPRVWYLRIPANRFLILAGWPVSARQQSRK